MLKAELARQAGKGGVWSVISFVIYLANAK